MVPSVVYYQCTMLKNFDYLIHIVLADGEGVYGLLNQYDELYLLDWEEWYNLGGLTTFARARQIEPVEIAE